MLRLRQWHARAAPHRQMVGAMVLSWPVLARDPGPAIAGSAVLPLPHSVAASGGGSDAGSSGRQPRPARAVPAWRSSLISGGRGSAGATVTGRVNPGESESGRRDS
jgi:hypothetical protein